MESIDGDDRLARAIFFADQFDGDAVGPNALLQFKGNRNADGTFDESLYMLRLTTPQGIHDLNCVREAALNAKVRAKRAARGLDPEPEAGVDKKYYCGFAAAFARALGPQGDNYVVVMEHAEEDGVAAHVRVVLTPRPDKRINAADRTEAGRLLALAFTDPTPHICDCDLTDQMHPVHRWGAGCLLVA